MIKYYRNYNLIDKYWKIVDNRKVFVIAYFAHGWTDSIMDKSDFLNERLFEEIYLKDLPDEVKALEDNVMGVIL